MLCPFLVIIIQCIVAILLLIQAVIAPAPSIAFFNVGRLPAVRTRISHLEPLAQALNMKNVFADQPKDFLAFEKLLQADRALHRVGTVFIRLICQAPLMGVKHELLNFVNVRIVQP